MRKLIEVSQEHSITCDNKSCDYKIINEKKDPNVCIAEYINMPCPECGENLLTEKDYIDSISLMKVVNWMNKWFSWLTLFSKKSDKGQEYTAHVYNGVNIEKKE